MTPAVSSGAVTALAVVGSVLQTPDRDSLQSLADVVIGVDSSGRITAVEPQSSDAGSAMVAAAGTVERLGPTEVLLPGLIDLHVHAPQWPQLGTCLDLPLDQWLFQYTFPLEARYADLGYAREVWRDLVGTVLRHGTTTAVYFSSIHEPATTALAQECVRQGQRAFVGRVAMDHPTGTPEWYRDASATVGVEASAQSIGEIRALDGGRDLVRPMITPRFTPACTDELLAGLGSLAAETGVAVQTHCSESDWAHGVALTRFGRSDTMALDGFGLLRPGSIVAHANHISGDDVDLLVRREVGVAHCPLSNAYFADGVFPARRWLDRGLRIGLGTDVAGGATCSVLSQVGDAITVSRMLEAGIDVVREPGERGVSGSGSDVLTAFWMATAGGAEVLGLPIGLIEPGRRFDAIVVDVAGLPAAASIDNELASRLVLERIVRLAGPADISATWVDGQKVVDESRRRPLREP